MRYLTLGEVVELRRAVIDPDHAEFLHDELVSPNDPGHFGLEER